MLPSTVLMTYVKQNAADPNPTTSPILDQSTGSLGAGTTQTAAITANTGDYMLLFLHRNFSSAGAAGTVSTVTDAKGNTWSRVGQRLVDGNSHQTFEIWAGIQSAAFSSFNITITWSGAGDAGSAVATSWAPVNAATKLDVTPVFDVYDSSVAGGTPSVTFTVPHQHGTIVQFAGSNQDLGGQPPSGLSWSGVGTSQTGTGTLATKLSVNSADNTTNTGPTTVNYSTGNNRFMIFGALVIKGT
jgi:hypothetical protein